MVENIPDYPTFAQDVYQVVCDYFSCLVEPLLTFALYDDVITVVGVFTEYIIDDLAAVKDVQIHYNKHILFSILTVLFIDEIKRMIFTLSWRILFILGIIHIS